MSCLLILKAAVLISLKAAVQISLKATVLMSLKAAVLISLKAAVLISLKAAVVISLKAAVNLTAKALKKVYKPKLTYRCQWESKYPWVYCEDPEKGMFCQICQKFGKPPATARGAWTSRGISDWNYGTEVRKAHNDSKSHKDAALVARMAEQPSVFELQQAAVAQHVSELRANNRAILLKLSRSVYFLVKHRIPHTSTFQDLLALQFANGDKLLEKHLTEGPGNAYFQVFNSISY